MSAREIGISTEEFYELTPREFFALLERHRHSFDVKYVLPVSQMAIIADFWAKCNGAKTKPADFIPQLHAPDPKGEEVQKDDGLLRMAMWQNLIDLKKSQLKQ